MTNSLVHKHLTCKLTVGSCFSGIGGLELGLEWTGGFETKWQVEIDPYATKVLEKHWPNVKRYPDITDIIRPESVDLICGGFPCQDVSMAGKRKGLDGKRTTLWGEMFRLICEVKPRWVVAENVPGLLSSDNGRFFGNILRDLDGGGMMRNGKCYQRPLVERRILDRGFFLLPTPNKSDGDQQNKSYLRAMETWETTSSLTAKLLGMDMKLTGRQKRPSGHWIINPSFTEWMMGFPHGWTKLIGMETPSYQPSHKRSEK